MIELTRLNGVHFFLNPELIEQIESAPDTVITLTTGNNFVVKDPLEAVLERIFVYRRNLLSQKKLMPRQIDSSTNMKSEARNR